MICSSYITLACLSAHSHPGLGTKIAKIKMTWFLRDLTAPTPASPTLTSSLLLPLFSESPWLCHATERTLLGSNRDTFSMHLGHFFHVWFGLQSPPSSTKLLEAYIWDRLTQVPLLCSFIISLPTVQNPSLFSFFLFWSSSGPLLVFCTSSVPLGSAMHLVCVGRGEKFSIKADKVWQHSANW